MDKYFIIIIIKKKNYYYYLKHNLSIFLNMFCYRFMFKYLEMSFKFSFNK
jgi:hypothetical protein